MHGRAPGNRGRGRPRRCWVTDICEWTRSTPSQAIRLAEKRDLGGGVYMRKLAPARVSYRDDFFISYRVYIMPESFHISLFEGTLHGDKIHDRKYYACATRSSLPADRFLTETYGRFAFTWYRCETSYRSEILAPVQQPGWTHAGLTRTGMTFWGGII